MLFHMPETEKHIPYMSFTFSDDPDIHMHRPFHLMVGSTFSVIRLDYILHILLTLILIVIFLILRCDIL